MLDIREKEYIIFILERFRQEQEGRTVIPVHQLAIQPRTIDAISSKLLVDLELHRTAKRKSQNRNQRKTAYKNHKKVL